MLWAASVQGLELRRAEDGSARLAGRFPYGVPTVLGRAGGRELREVFAAGALRPAADVRLLAQHDPAKPLASVGTATLSLAQDDAALRFEARLSAAVAQSSHGRDALALLDAGLAVGVSPGFRVEADGEEVRHVEGATLRTITCAELLELSVVTVPAYPAAQVEARSWSPGGLGVATVAPRRRWRA
jgi:hypothetical protein